MRDINKVISHLKEKGFVFPSSNIYGGLANSWDYGPLGTILKDNIKTLWKKTFIDQQESIFHMDSSIILNPKVWEASGHVSKFNDPMVDCKSCKSRFRSDKIIDEIKGIDAESLSFEEQSELMKDIDCPNCKAKDWTEVRAFELMFKTSGSKVGDEDTLFLRPETAQGVFINFKNIIDTINPKVPFGIGQIGKAFRNEVTPGNFIFRTKEFEQLELEYFTTPENATIAFDEYQTQIDNFLNTIGISKNVSKYEVPSEKLAHYSSRTIDYEYDFSFGKGELLGLANRGDFDLKTHGLEYNDQVNGGKFVPHVIETSMGVERLLLAIASEHLVVEKDEEGEREVFKLPMVLCPYKVAVLPLTNKVEEEAHNLYLELLKQDLGPIDYAKSGTVGKRYRKQDSIGTMYCITFDFDSIEDNKVTIRHRDTMEQERINISDIKEYIVKNAK